MLKRPQVVDITMAILAALAIGLLAVDGRSLWTDELGTWYLTRPDTLAQWAAGLWHCVNSDGQIPLYHLYMRMWSGAFGDSELALRLANIPFLALFLLAICKAPVDRNVRFWALLLSAVHAFFWYYANDARPYLMYVAGAAWVTVALMRLALSDEATLATSANTAFLEICVGIPLLIGGNILGAFWLLIVVPALAFYRFDAFLAVLKAALRHRAALLVSLTVSVAIVAVALHSYFNGARASQAASFSLAGVAYGVIELFGLAGLGPSRNALRQASLTANLVAAMPMLLAAVAVALGYGLAWKSARDRGLRWFALVCAVGPILVLVGLGILLHWRVVGRHMSAVLPLLIFSMAAFLSHVWSKRLSWQRGLVISLIGLFAVSSLLIRWSPSHQKDNYRQAAVWATKALTAGKTVLWLADERGIDYYDTRVGGTLVPAVQSGKLMPSVSFPLPLKGPMPDCIIFSPREAVDPTGLVRQLLVSGKYQLVDQAMVFELYQRP